VNIFRYIEDLWWKWIYYREYKAKEKDPEHLMTTWEYSQWAKEQNSKKVKNVT
jgi:hypothetical protein